MAKDHGQDEDCARKSGLPGLRPGKLLHLADYEPVQPERILGELRGYWEGLRQGRAIPDRADIEPRGIRRALDYAFILERIAPGAARFRLAGRHLIDLMGMEVRGMPLCAFLNTSSRGRLSDVLESVFRGPQIAEMTLESPAGYGRPALEGRLLLLPLRSDLGDVTRALGCLIAQGRFGEAPRRFDLLSDQEFPVIPGARVLEPSPSRAGFAEPPAPWSGICASSPSDPPPDPATPEERRARFRIVSSTEPPKPRGRRF
ncbi:MAG: PAS domain-containing protein [Paracoccus sp. BP8]|uniref:PAS domain-containing protein n=1 Tax=unclassified Paracoccus (in: a-proteobacteria) TaxID=2688777 RepID=UPI00048F794D|nr:MULTISPECIES: PAS domain-containing protein [unclassified Paracoccus (in: a-proteobacteria)]RQP04997.1 MAG: PAS domain-containing protein [Paracoccus sp. BP8]